ncbi:ankyrin repeat and SOCS box protein 9-like isoform X2 [Branchiostoma lanceolatum]|uniref:ankyrin repeat and SOCS box protein 9-like isoform X2 n=1 Tax=Branchiostoma lanceolatum TaxID=7740 RepID=UPI003454583C
MATVRLGPGETYDANEFLLDAVENGSIWGVKTALNSGADIDFERPDGELTRRGTALFIACARGHEDIVRLLLRKGASVVKRTLKSFAPLHAASSRGWTEVVELLVNHGATVDIRDGFQNTPLMTACVNKRVHTVRRLLEFGARPDLTDGHDAQRMGIADENHVCRGFCDCHESMKMIQEARKTRLLRCCNPKCGKPGYKSTGTLKLCARCKMTRYCSRDCQRQHWSIGHKKCCGHDACSEDQGMESWRKLMTLMAEHVRDHGHQPEF